jgi:4-hydroxy-2-oxoglutarate aldolase
MRYRGVFPPITTPFSRDGALDAGALRSNAARWMRSRLAGLVVLGSNGEAPLLDDEESVKAIEAARAEVPRARLLIAGTGRESTRAAIAATRRAATAGADAVLVRTPSYFKSRMTTDALVAHFIAVADASPVPVILYNFPAVTGIDLAPAAVERLSAHPNVAGVKESAGDVGRIAEDVARTPEGFAVLAGAAPVFHASLLAGACAGVLAVACVAPDLCVTLYDLVVAGRHDEAAALQRRLTPLARLVSSGHGVPGLKAALDLVGFAGGSPRGPLLPVPADAVDHIRGELVTLDLIEPARSHAS